MAPATNHATLPRPAGNWASNTSAPGPTLRAPTARPSASSRHRYENGPGPRLFGLKTARPRTALLHAPLQLASTSCQYRTNAAHHQTRPDQGQPVETPQLVHPPIQAHIEVSEPARVGRTSMPKPDYPSPEPIQGDLGVFGLELIRRPDQGHKADFGVLRKSPQSLDDPHQRLVLLAGLPLGPTDRTRIQPTRMVTTTGTYANQSLTSERIFAAPLNCDRNRNSFSLWKQN